MKRSIAIMMVFATFLFTTPVAYAATQLDEGTIGISVDLETGLNEIILDLFNVSDDSSAGSLLFSGLIQNNGWSLADQYARINFQSAFGSYGVRIFTDNVTDHAKSLSTTKTLDETYRILNSAGTAFLAQAGFQDILANDGTRYRNPPVTYATAFPGDPNPAASGGTAGGLVGGTLADPAGNQDINPDEAGWFLNNSMPLGWAVDDATVPGIAAPVDADFQGSPSNWQFLANKGDSNFGAAPTPSFAVDGGGNPIATTIGAYEIPWQDHGGGLFLPFHVDVNGDGAVNFDPAVDVPLLVFTKAVTNSAFNPDSGFGDVVNATQVAAIIAPNHGTTGSFGDEATDVDTDGRNDVYVYLSTSTDSAVADGSTFVSTIYLELVFF